MKKNLLTFIKLVLILVFLIFLIKLIDVENLKEVIVKARIEYMIIAILLTPLIVLLKSYKWHLLINKSKKVSYSESLKSYLAGYSMSVISPIRGGEFSRIIFINAKLSHATFLVILDKLIDVSIICAYALIGLVLFFPKYSFIILAIIILLFFIIYNPQMILDISLRLISHFKFLKRICQKIEECKPIPITHNLSTGLILITFFSYFIAYSQFYLWLSAFDPNVTLKQVIFIIPLSSVAKGIPLKVAGGPLSVILIIFLFALYGISKEAVLGAIFLNFIFYFLVIAITGFPIASKRLYMLKRKKKRFSNP